MPCLVVRVRARDGVVPERCQTRKEQPQTGTNPREEAGRRRENEAKTNNTSTHAPATRRGGTKRYLIDPLAYVLIEEIRHLISLFLSLSSFRVWLWLLEMRALFPSLQGREKRRRRAVPRRSMTKKKGSADTTKTTPHGQEYKGRGYLLLWNHRKCSCSN